MDTLREEEDREVNHHGKAVDVGTDNAMDKTKINNWIVKIGSKDLVSTKEELQQRAIRNTIQFATFFLLFLSIYLNQGYKRISK